MDEINVSIERVDDLPLLGMLVRTMGVAEVVDECMPTHGNWKGLSPGQIVAGWLLYLMSESDHRLYSVEPWAAERIETLSHVLGVQVGPKDFTDDRLGALLTKLGDDECWEKIEDALNRRHLQVFSLPTEVVRLDTTAVSVYHEVEGHTLIAYGHSKDHRPDLPQLKVMVGALDPLAMPLVTEPVAGNESDDPLYIPAIERVRAGVTQRGLVYVGDNKMEKKATRGHLVAGGDYYLLPLSQKRGNKALLQEYVQKALADEGALQVWEKQGEEWVWRGREWEREQRYVGDEIEVTWCERVLVVQSRRLYEKQRRGLEQRLARAQAKIERLTPPPKQGQRQFRELAPLKERVERILKEHRVEGFLEVTYHEEVQEMSGKRSKKRYRVQVTRREEVLEETYPTLGWRLYVTNVPQERLSMAQAIRLYRGGVPTIEHLFSRLKGRPLGLRPLFLRLEERIKGLVRLLSLALRGLTLLEYQVREALAEEGEALAGLYPGNPKRATSRPTAERLLEAFKGIHLTRLILPQGHVCVISPLSPLQMRILELLRYSPSIYTDLTQQEPVPI